MSLLAVEHVAVFLDHFGAFVPRQNTSHQLEKERGWIDGGRLTSAPQSHSQTPRFHHWAVREAARDTQAAAAGSPIAKDVPVLRLDHLASQNLLPGMRPVAQARLVSDQ